MCGGGWKMGIYSTGMTGYYFLLIINNNYYNANVNNIKNKIFIDFLPKKYVGCFEDDEKKPKGKYLSYEMGTNNSPKRCINLCNTHRFKYAAVKK